MEFDVLNRLWNWLIGNQKVDINVKIEIKDLEKLLKVLHRSSHQPVIIDNGQTDVEENNSPTLGKEQPTKRRKKLVDDPMTSSEVASIMLSDGIEKATDKTGSDVVSASEGISTDDTVSSLKQFLGGKKKDV